MGSNAKNKIAIPIVIAILAFIVYSFIKNTGKVDDWVFTGTSTGELPSYWFIIAGLIILTWVVISLYLIIKAKSSKKGMSPERKLGIFLLIGPILLFSFGFFFLSGSGIALLIILILFIIFVICGIVYAIKYKSKIALALLLLIPLIILVFIGYVAYSIVSFEEAMPVGIPSYAPIGPPPLPSMGIPEMDAFPAPKAVIGFATGGAKDVGNFRENIENDFLPLSSDITYEGLFYDYFFDTGQITECKKLFCPSYSYALSKDPFSKEEEYYLQVGLNSGIKEEDFKRKKLNLVIVLDISGSMGSSFRDYYYDRFGNKQTIEEDSDKNKMEIANEAVVGLLDHLNDEDRFGMVLFDDGTYLGKQLGLVGNTDMDAIKGHILDLEASGGTFMEGGMKGGTKLFDKFLNVDQEEYENRIIFLTDAMPNLGETSEEGLLGLTKRNAGSKIYTTFIGIGVDFNTELIETLTKIRGANYYSVHSAKEFKTRMDDEFEYMVTPLVFNLLLHLDAKGFEIEKVYGSPEADESTGDLMKINTLFPSKRVEKETKGGIVILKLKKVSEDTSLTLISSYEDRSEKLDSDVVDITLPKVEADYFNNTGIRKGILLSRYVNLMRNWIDDERKSYEENNPVKPTITFETGILHPHIFEVELGRWERQSIDLSISKEHRELFKEFKKHFEAEITEIKDETLLQEVEILDILINYES